MKKAQRWTALLCALALMLTLSPPVVSAAESPASSRNINGQDYATYGTTVKSYLYENDQGGVTRVEYTGGELIVEDYDEAYELTDSRTISVSLPLWGGFFAGEDANFVISGQNNNSENDSTEVICVEKYSKDWRFEGSASLNGANTTVPFDAGSLRCAEYGGYLYVRTCHEMYTSEDGLNHQSNLTFQVDESRMDVVDAYYDVWCVDYGYISHSFNQFILIDQDRNIIGLDHGDSGSLSMGPNYQPFDVDTRGVTLTKYDRKAGESGFTAKTQKFCDYSIIQNFAGRSGNNTTGGSIGGLAETSGGYVTAFSYDGVGSRNPRDIYLGYTSKSSLSSSSSVISTTSGVSTPVLAPTGLGGGFVLWNGKSGSTPDDTLYYTAYSDGGRVGSVKTDTAPLSDCQPIYHDGMAVWYVTDNSAPTFYGLDDTGVTVLNGGGSQTPEDPEDPEEPVGPSMNGIMTSSDITFSAAGAIMKDGTLLDWNKEGVTQNHGGSYRSIYSWGTNLLLETNGRATAWPAQHDSIFGDHKLYDSSEESNPAYQKATAIGGGVILYQNGGLSFYSPDWGWEDYTDAGTDNRQAYGRCFIKEDNTLWNWYGDNWSLEYPHGYPVKMMDDVAYVTDCMAIKTDGSLWSWDRINQHGEVGNGTMGVPTPDPVKIMDNIVGAWGGISGRFALDSSGNLYSWGSNIQCNLGYEGGNKTLTLSNGNKVDCQTVPRKVNISDVVAVDVVNYGPTLALKKDGTLWACGYIKELPNGAAQADSRGRSASFVKILDGVLLPGSTPTVKPEEPEKPEKPTTWAIMTNPNYTYSDDAAIMANGDVLCWFSDYWDDGETDTTTRVVGQNFKAIEEYGYIDQNSDYWMMDTTGNFRDVLKLAGNVRQSAGHSLILKNDGTVWSWYPPEGCAEPGEAHEYAFVTDNAKQVAIAERFESHSVNYVLKNDGSLWSWADLDYDYPLALLGRDEGRQSKSLRKVMDNVAYVSGGMAIKTDGSLWSWGDWYTVGDGSKCSYSPVKIMDNVAGAWGDERGCFALTKDGKLYSWGGGHALGYPDRNLEIPPSGSNMGESYQTVPKLVNIENVCSVWHGLFQTRDGTLWEVDDSSGITKFKEGTKPCGVVVQGTTSPSRPSGGSSSSGGGSTKPGTIISNNGGGTNRPSTPNPTPKPNPTPAPDPTPTAPEPVKNPFTDVPSGAYYHDAVLWAAENGITTGVTATEFRPGSPCTRGQVVTFLWRAKGCPEPKTKTNPFTDVSASSPFYKAILWAYESGITAGQSASSFNPGGTCTGGHVVTFLWRASGKPAAAGNSSLAAANPGKYYTDAVAWADAAGLLTGSAFAPGDVSPRADIVTYLYRNMAD